MRCPIDGSELVITDRSGVEIDYCPQCRGVWLDRGELDKIIDRSAAHMPPPPPRSTHPEPERGFDESRYRDDERYRKKKKRGGFLEELFDF
ncbi:zf-TFIIB domain-containing protein [Marivita sp. S2033]|uniref:TFIIB-type zinc ribbon-containing protein n=1 Tax=Marivita sp. S2033 TaxID=3373187 RepID=UPI003982AF98